MLSSMAQLSPAPALFPPWQRVLPVAGLRTAGGITRIHMMSVLPRATEDAHLTKSRSKLSSDQRPSHRRLLRN